MSGKGDKWRNGVNYKRYWTNFPAMSGEHNLRVTKVIKKHGKTIYVYEKTVRGISDFKLENQKHDGQEA